ncbi:hypothetical protein PISMIDRAFT_15719 [Pisolithus microcarpus 441]|uniref:Uncharacterized protein n=1 Tax=Pisolithus microcarpus 441 TaxID=765257 RepID=A0A0C9Z2J5_9AGAM|nr:hypothetical protein PISMIDRAFT_15719 [Pisolithus microcarpus 441]
MESQDTNDLARDQLEEEDVVWEEPTLGDGDVVNDNEDHQQTNPPAVKAVQIWTGLDRAGQGPRSPKSPNKAL